MNENDGELSYKNPLKARFDGVTDYSMHKNADFVCTLHFLKLLMDFCQLHQIQRQQQDPLNSYKRNFISQNIEVASETLAAVHHTNIVNIQAPLYASLYLVYYEQLLRQLVEKFSSNLLFYRLFDTNHCLYFENCLPLHWLSSFFEQCLWKRHQSLFSLWRNHFLLNCDCCILFGLCFDQTRRNRLHLQSHNPRSISINLITF